MIAHLCRGRLSLKQNIVILFCFFCFSMNCNAQSCSYGPNRETITAANWEIRPACRNESRSLRHYAGNKLSVYAATDNNQVWSVKSVRGDFCKIFVKVGTKRMLVTAPKNTGEECSLTLDTETEKDSVLWRISQEKKNSFFHIKSKSGLYLTHGKCDNAGYGASDYPAIRAVSSKPSDNSPNWCFSEVMDDRDF